MLHYIGNNRHGLTLGGFIMAKKYKENYYESEEIKDTIIVPVTLDDGNEVDCEVLSIFPAEGRQYAALLPLDEQYTDIFLYRFIPQGEEEFLLDGIETDEEYEIVADVFDMLLDDEEFEAIMEEDED